MKIYFGGKMNSLDSNQPYGSGQNNNDYQRQGHLDADRKKHSYKMAAEQALDHIARDYQNAQANNLENWKLDPSDKAAVVRYFKRYWDTQFISYSISIVIVTFVLSFYTKLAVFGIFGVFILREALSQQVLLTYLLNDHELTRKQITDIKDKIFYKQLKTKGINDNFKVYQQEYAADGSKVTMKVLPKSKRKIFFSEHRQILYV